MSTQQAEETFDWFHSTHNKSPVHLRTITLRAAPTTEIMTTCTARSNIRNKEQAVLKKPSSPMRKKYAGRRPRCDVDAADRDLIGPLRSPCTSKCGSQRLCSYPSERKRLVKEDDSSRSIVRSRVDKAILRSQQRRLLALYHSATCTRCHQQSQTLDNDGDPSKRCPHYSFKMNLLWKHMSTCSDSNCTVEHCYSSRVILTHHLRCKDGACRICAPVRIAEKLNNNKKSDVHFCKEW